jgi:hypothetical protein
VHRRDILKFIDSQFGVINQAPTKTALSNKSEKKQTKMRRTYDILNIMLTAEVFSLTEDKRYTYNPFVLEHEDEAMVQR